MKKVKWLTSLYLLLFITGCATVTSNIYHSPSGRTPPLSSKILILPSDVAIYVKTAGGSNELRADWSKNVRENLGQSISNFMFENGVQLVPYASQQIQDEHVGVLRQATVMMDAIELMQRQTGIGAERHYALGEGSIQALADFEADYVLVTALRTEIASGGRQVVALLGAFSGATITTSSAQFRAAIFDLRDGQLTWANFDPHALSDVGNLTTATEEDWTQATEHILSEFPL